MRKRLYADIETVAKIRELCVLGARPPVLRALFPSFPDVTITNIWVDACGERPPRGPLPYNVLNFLSNPRKRLEVAIVINVFKRLRACGLHDIDAMIGTYHACLERLTDTQLQSGGPFTFDRVWFLCREFTSLKSLRVVQCRDCGCNYAQGTHEPINHDNCPMRTFSGICGIKNVQPKAAAAKSSMVLRHNDESQSGVLWQEARGMARSRSGRASPTSA